MRVLASVLLVVLVPCGMHMHAKIGDVDDLYKKIGARLADVKKQAPACAATIGLVLDDFDRMYKATRVSQQQDNAAMKELETKAIENAVLQKELTTAKQEAAALKQVAQEDQLKVVELTKELEKERAQVAILKEQNNQLQQKTGQQQDLISAEISKIDKQFGAKSSSSTKENDTAPVSARNGATVPNQNLNRTSTSEPISPR